MQKYTYLSLLLLLFACAPKQPKPSRDMLSQTQMSDIITELHIADALAMSNKSRNQDSMKAATVNYRNFIFDKYHISHEQFLTSFEFYKQNPILLDSVYAEVVTKLSSKEMLYRGK